MRRRILFILLAVGFTAAAFGGVLLASPTPEARFFPWLPTNVELPKSEARLTLFAPPDPPGVILRSGKERPQNIFQVLTSVMQTLFLSPSIYDNVLFAPQTVTGACVAETVLQDLPRDSSMSSAAQEIIDAANALGVNPLYMFGIAAAESSFCTNPNSACLNGATFNAWACGGGGRAAYSSWVEAQACAANAVKAYGETSIEAIVCHYVEQSMGTDACVALVKAGAPPQGVRDYTNTVVGVMDKLSRCVAGGLPQLPQPLIGGPGPLFSSAQTHRICLDQQCVAVAGPGVDRCSNTGDCQSRHTTCLGSQCIILYEPGDDECILPDVNNPNNPANNNLIGFPGKCPTPLHKECVGDGLGKRCAVVPGPGPDTCTTDKKCEEPPEPSDIPECGTGVCIDAAECVRFRGRIIEGSCDFAGGGICCRLTRPQG